MEKKIIFNELNILLSQREQILKYVCKVTPLPYINKLIRTVTLMISFYKHIHTDKKKLDRSIWVHSKETNTHWTKEASNQPSNFWLEQILHNN